MTLAEAFSIGDKEVISLVGAGGKTTLLYALGRELSTLRTGIILTTTTKIFEPEPSPFFLQYLSSELSTVKKWTAEHLERDRMSSPRQGSVSPTANSKASLPNGRKNSPCWTGFPPSSTKPTAQPAGR